MILVKSYKKTYKHQLMYLLVSNVSVAQLVQLTLQFLSRPTKIRTSNTYILHLTL